MNLLENYQIFYRNKKYIQKITFKEEDNICEIGKFKNKLLIPFFYIPKKKKYRNSK